MPVGWDAGWFIQKRGCDSALFLQIAPGPAIDHFARRVSVVSLLIAGVSIVLNFAQYLHGRASLKLAWDFHKGNGQAVGPHYIFIVTNNGGQPVTPIGIRVYTKSGHHDLPAEFRMIKPTERNTAKYYARDAHQRGKLFKEAKRITVFDTQEREWSLTRRRVKSLKAHLASSV
jgi:hypothetical protein